MTASPHDLRGMVRASRRRHHRAHRAMIAECIYYSPRRGRLGIRCRIELADAVHRALRELRFREERLALKGKVRP